MVNKNNSYFHKGRNSLNPPRIIDNILTIDTSLETSDPHYKRPQTSKSNREVDKKRSPRMIESPLQQHTGCKKEKKKQAQLFNDPLKAITKKSQKNNAKVPF